MSDAITVALIGLTGSLIGSLLGILASSKLTQYRIEQLEKKVEKHNSVIERTFKLETNEEVIEKEIEHLGEVIHRLEKYHEAE